MFFKSNAIRILLMLLILQPLSASQSLYVLNSLAETVSYWDGTTILNNTTTLGLYPNDLLVKGDTLLALNSGSHNLQIFNRHSNALLGTITLPVNSNPYEMTLVNNEEVLISLFQSNQLARIDLRDGTISDPVVTGPSPEGIIVVNDKIYATSSNFNGSDWTYGQGKVIVHDLESLEMESEILVPANPQKLILASDGKLHVLCTGDYFSIFGQVVRIDLQTGTVVDTLLTGGSPGSFGEDVNGVVYLAGGGWGSAPSGLVYTYTVDNFSMVHGESNPIEVGHGIMSVTSNPQTAGAWVASFDTDEIFHITATGAVTDQITVGDGPSKIALVPEVSSSVADLEKMPDTFTIGPAYPNPFNPSTSFEISLSQPSQVMINIFSLNGQRVTQLASSDFSPGRYHFQWTGETNQHLPVASGVYVLETIINQDRSLQKITLIR